MYTVMRMCSLHACTNYKAQACFLLALLFTIAMHVVYILAAACSQTQSHKMHCNQSGIPNLRHPQNYHLCMMSACACEY